MTTETRMGASIPAQGHPRTAFVRPRNRSRILALRSATQLRSPGSLEAEGREGDEESSCATLRPHRGRACMPRRRRLASKLRLCVGRQPRSPESLDSGIAGAQPPSRSTSPACKWRPRAASCCQPSPRTPSARSRGRCSRTAPPREPERPATRRLGRRLRISLPRP